MCIDVLPAPSLVLGQSVHLHARLGSGELDDDVMIQWCQSKRQLQDTPSDGSPVDVISGSETPDLRLSCLQADVTRAAAGAVRSEPLPLTNDPLYCIITLKGSATRAARLKSHFVSFHVEG